MNKPRKKRIGFDTSRTTKKLGRKKTFRNAEAGFEIDVPDDWSLPAAGTLEDIVCLPDEAI
jgi:hypothetical protein